MLCFFNISWHLSSLQVPGIQMTQNFAGGVYLEKRKTHVAPDLVKDKIGEKGPHFQIR